MRITSCRVAAFSPCGGTLAVLRAIGAGLGLEVLDLNITLPADRRTVDFAPDELAVIGFPVYGGRLPHNAKEVLDTLHGRSTPAVLVAVYGNRDYEDALEELRRESVARGFVPVAGCAAVAEHVMVPSVAQGRPDEVDRELLRRFGQAIRKYLESEQGAGSGDLQVPGVVPYRKEPLRVRVAPRPGADCDNCGVCAERCPAGAIPADARGLADDERCLICMACVRLCPRGSRKPAHPSYTQATSWLLANCRERKEPEFFPAMFGS